MAFTWVELVRVIHVLAAVVWVGGGVFALLIVGPSVRAAGEAGQKFMAAVAKRGGPARLMGPAGITTILSGILVYWQYEYWQEPFLDAPRSVLTVGALLGFLVLAVGMSVGMPMQRRMQALAAQVGPGGPTPEQKANLDRHGARLSRFGIASTWLLVVALVLMAGRNLVA